MPAAGAKRSHLRCVASRPKQFRPIDALQMFPITLPPYWAQHHRCRLYWFSPDPDGASRSAEVTVTAMPSTSRSSGSTTAGTGISTRRPDVYSMRIGSIICIRLTSYAPSRHGLEKDPPHLGQTYGSQRKLFTPAMSIRAVKIVLVGWPYIESSKPRLLL